MKQRLALSDSSRPPAKIQLIKWTETSPSSESGLVIAEFPYDAHINGQSKDEAEALAILLLSTIKL